MTVTVPESYEPIWARNVSGRGGSALSSTRSRSERVVVPTVPVVWMIATEPTWTIHSGLPPLNVPPL